jgi:hypothetical protein
MLFCVALLFFSSAILFPECCNIEPFKMVPLRYRRVEVWSLLCFALLSFSGPYAWGQVAGTDNDQTRVPMPVPGKDYVTGVNEIVSPASGTLAIRLSIPTPRSLLKFA